MSVCVYPHAVLDSSVRLHMQGVDCLVFVLFQIRRTSTRFSTKTGMKHNHVKMMKNVGSLKLFWVMEGQEHEKATNQEQKNFYLMIDCTLTVRSWQNMWFEKLFQSYLMFCHLMITHTSWTLRTVNQSQTNEIFFLMQVWTWLLSFCAHQTFT